jgi:hypothetical protein
VVSWPLSVRGRSPIPASAPFFDQRLGGELAEPATFLEALQARHAILKPLAAHHGHGHEVGPPCRAW